MFKQLNEFVLVISTRYNAQEEPTQYKKCKCSNIKIYTNIDDYLQNKQMTYQTSIGNIKVKKH